MAEYIDRKRLKEVFNRNVVSANVFNDIIDAQPTADVVEREKIDKTIEEIKTLPIVSSKTKCDEQGFKIKGECIETIDRDKVLEILKRNIGE